MQLAEEMQVTSVLRARRDSPSLKTTIPEMYATLLKLKPGDSLEWDHEITNNEVTIRIKKAVRGKVLK
jgi:hypothetical protein